jgi:mRNA interferase RelE/StbE
MIVRFSKNSTRFIDSLVEKQQKRIKEQIIVLKEYIENSGSIPFRELDIKKLSGQWEGYYRMRVGQMRIIFNIESEKNQINIFTINFRGDVYKN